MSIDFSEEKKEIFSSEKRKVDSDSGGNKFSSTTSTSGNITSSMSYTNKHVVEIKKKKWKTIFSYE